MTCQQEGCTRKGELACMVGEVRKVLCIEHQARYRQAMSCGGRKIVIHHGVDLEDWSRPTVRRAMPAEDIPDLGLPLSSYVPPPPVLEQLPAVIAAAATYGHTYPSNLVHSPPPAPPVPPPTLQVIMPVSRPLCLWSDCDRPNQQGVCCMMHNDRLRKLYGSAARLTEEQINAAPKAWDKRMEERAEASRAQLAEAGKAKAAASVKARPVAPAAEEVPTVKAAPVERVASSPPATDAPNVALALVLLDAAADLILDRKLRALLDAARAVLS
jgi:hypothetical protein